MTTIYKWKIYCITDSKWEYVWSETAPTTCPTDTGHTVNPNSVSDIEVISETIMAIKENTNGTGDHVKFDTIVINTPANQTTSSTINWPIPVNVLSLNFKTTGDNEDDQLNCCVSPDTTIGAITQDVTVNDTVINVDSSVISNISIGFYVKLDDGVDVSDLGRIISIDSGSNTITVETAASNSHAASTPTVVKLTVFYIKDYNIGLAGNYILGDSKIGGSLVPANTNVCFDYINNSVSVAKKLIVQIEYIY